MNIKKAIILFLLITCLANGFSQTVGVKNTTISESEKIKYNLYYNLSLIWLQAGTATMNFSLDNSNYHAQIAGSTIKSFDPIFKVRDTFEVYMDTVGMTPIYYKEVNREDKYYLQKEYNIQYTDHHASFFAGYKDKNNTWHDTINTKNSTTDIVSVMYRLRNSDLHDIKVKDSLKFTLFTDDKAYDLYLVYMGVEEIKLRSGDKYRCKKFCPLTPETQLFTKGDKSMQIWVSDDDNNLIVAAEAKLKVGSVKIMMDKAEDIKYPLSSLVKKGKRSA